MSIKKFSLAFMLLLMGVASNVCAGEVKTLKPEIIKLGILDDEQRNARYLKCEADLKRLFEKKSGKCQEDLNCFKKNESETTKKCIDEFSWALQECANGIFDLGSECGDDGSWDCGFAFENMKASSTLKSQGSNSYDVESLSGLSVLSAWSEGVPGYGIGEKISAKIGAAQSKIRGLRIINGYSKSKTAYYNNSRVKELLVYKNGKPVAKLLLQDIPDAFQEFDLELSNGDELVFEIVDVYKGKKYDDTLLTLLTFRTYCY